MADLIRSNIENTVNVVEKKLEQTKYWITRMADAGMDVQKLQLKQIREELRLNQLKGLL